MGGGRSVAVALADALRERGVRRLFGVPGSGSSLDLIGAAARVGIDFVLTRTETAAAIMASVTAELTGAPGVVVTGLGPGAAAVANGVAYAALDRAPLVVVTDTHAPAQGFATHQRFDHAALFAPLVKRSYAPTGATSAAGLAALLDEALASPQGPVHIDLSGPAAAETGPRAAGRERRGRRPAPEGGGTRPRRGRCSRRPSGRRSSSGSRRGGRPRPRARSRPIWAARC